MISEAVSDRLNALAHFFIISFAKIIQEAIRLDVTSEINYF